LTAGLCYGIGAVIPLVAMTRLPRAELLALTFVAILFALGLTGWFAAWLTGLPVIRLVRRTIVLGSAVMAAGILAGLALD
jgi:VIT1/CCC1 family predicted Fe2+/Mn2+ transporter